MAIFVTCPDPKTLGFFCEELCLLNVIYVKKTLELFKEVAFDEGEGFHDQEGTNIAQTDQMLDVAAVPGHTKLGLIRTNQNAPIVFLFRAGGPKSPF